MTTDEDDHARRNRQLDQLLHARHGVQALAFLGLAMTLALVVVCDVVFAGTTAAIVPAVVAPAFAWFWFAAPLLRRRRDRMEDA
jgi:hypothetical protein